MVRGGSRGVEERRGDGRGGRELVFLSRKKKGAGQVGGGVVGVRDSKSKYSRGINPMKVADV